MRKTTLMAAVAVLAAVAGCGGDGRMQTKGKLLKGGQPCIPKEGESYNVCFVPILPDGKPPADYYMAIFEPKDGSFSAAGKDLMGMPPGKYRVSVEHMKNKKDLLRGKFDAQKSPYVFDVDAGTKEIVIDLDKPPAK